ncbi:MAG: S49 family peptidase [Rhodospirillaceae bacterium]|jgi:signal peptide peptidase SppA|nr:S49 family peptidase [Rhodospirillaceae bacterium]MBT7731447.1 S49 family peptidase [Rhodospirillaceae bacterium]
MEKIKKYIPFRKKAPQVGVIKLTGVIGASGSFRKGLNLQSIETFLQDAFSNKRITAVALIINSPGGSPVQSDLIQKRIRDLSTEFQKPVFVFCEDVAASGGYWIALAGDEIYANASSIIGSIGVVSAGFGFKEAISKLGVERRIYSTGPNKGMLDPFVDEDPKHIERLKLLQDEIFTLFREWVLSRRGEKLNGTHEELFSGAFWTGIQAKELGLIDGLGDLREIMRNKFGDKVLFKEYAAKTGILSKLGLAGSSEFSLVTDAKINSLFSDAMEWIEQRVTWGRFGL